MKKVVGFIFASTLVALFATHSMYLEWTEIFIIIGSLSAISVSYNLFSIEKGSLGNALGSSALIGFFLSWVFSLIDLVADHYFDERGIPDGRNLTLNETIMEFSDDLLIVSFIIMCSVVLISLVVTELYWKFYKRGA